MILDKTTKTRLEGLRVGIQTLERQMAGVKQQPDALAELQKQIAEAKLKFADLRGL